MVKKRPVVKRSPPRRRPPRTPRNHVRERGLMKKWRLIFGRTFDTVIIPPFRELAGGAKLEVAN